MGCCWTKPNIECDDWPEPHENTPLRMCNEVYVHSIHLSDEDKISEDPEDQIPEPVGRKKKGRYKKMVVEHPYFRLEPES